MRRGLILSILFFFGVALFILTIQRVGLNQVIDVFFLLQKREIFLIFLTLFIGTIVIGAWKWSVILGDNEKNKLSFRKIFLAKWVGLSVSYLTPSASFGGEPVKILLLARETDISNAKLISSVILDRIIFFLISSTYFFIGIFFILVYLNLSWLAGIIAFGLFFIIIFLCWAFIQEAKKISERRGVLITIIDKLRLHKLKFIRKHIIGIVQVEKEVKDFFKTSKKRAIRACVLGAVEVSFILMSCWLTIFFMGTRLEISKLFAIRSITDIAYAVPVPAALGAFEIGQAYLFQLFGLGLATGVGFSLIYRLVSLIIAFGGMIIFGYLQIKYFIQKVFRKIINFFIFLIKNE